MSRQGLRLPGHRGRDSHPQNRSAHPTRCRCPVELSPEIVELLKRQVKGKQPTAWVFPKAAALQDAKGWMIRASGRVCKRAGVPRVTPHGLRGSGATTDVLDEVVARVSKQLGHTDTAVTMAHYLDNEVLAQLQRLLARSQRGPKALEPVAA
jgi:integrase